MPDTPSIRLPGGLHDSALEEEIELLADLMEAAAHTRCRLPEDELDRALGVDRPPARRRLG